MKATMKKYLLIEKIYRVWKRFKEKTVRIIETMDDSIGRQYYKQKVKEKTDDKKPKP